MNFFLVNIDNDIQTRAFKKMLHQGFQAEKVSI